MLLTGCGEEERGGEGRVRVVAAFYPLAYAAERVGGEAVEVVDLTPPGAEPHDLELSARDVERVRSADLVLYLGGGFQPAVERAVERARGTVLDLRGGARDPHVWLDPLRYARIVRRIGRALARPRRAARLAGRLRRLDSEFRSGLARCERRHLVASHAAFGHLAARYRLEQIAIGGLAPESEPTAKELERIVAAVRASGAKTVYTETLASPRVARTVARETGADVAVLDPLEGLAQDELERGRNYFSVMRSNLAALRRGLGCR